MSRTTSSTASGTTGLPKGIVHTHYVRMMYCTLFASAWRMTPESVVCHARSIVFDGSMLTLMPWMYRLTYVLLDHFDVHLLIETIRRERVTHVYMVPSQMRRCCTSPTSTKRRAVATMSGSNQGAPLLKEQKEESQRRRRAASTNSMA